MLWSLKNHTYPIGVDMGDDSIKLIQLGGNSKSVGLIAGGSIAIPEAIKPGSSVWQKWAIEAIKRVIADGKFHGREVMAALPASEVFIEHMKSPKLKGSELQKAVISAIKSKLPFEAENAAIKCIPAENDNVLVVATNREKINRHLAIYEQSNLHIKSIGIWPLALINSYSKFFGRRKSDVNTVVMLLDIKPSGTNVVIARHKDLLFARSILISANQLEGDEALTKLILELNACRKQFSSMYKKAQIERLIFLSGTNVETNICTTIAKKLELPAQMGNCLAAVETNGIYQRGIERREGKVSWATAFGLSLS